MDKDYHKIVKGVGAEVLTNIIFYPLNTIRIRKQINLKTSSSLLLGLKWSMVSEIINSVVFYSVFQGLSKITNPMVGSSLGAGAGLVCSFKTSVMRKRIQTFKPITDINYNGLGCSLLNTIPGVTINFTLREYLKQKPEFERSAGLISTMVSVILTHPLDTFTTCLVTKTKVCKTLLYKGFKERLLEKNLTIGSKMILLELFDF